MSVTIDDRAQRIPAGVSAPRELNIALRDWQASVVRLDAVDPVTTELVRLRCARHHACRICSSLRLVTARDAGLDETMADKIDRHWDSDLSDAHKAALRLADCLMTQPGAIDDELRTELRRHYTDEQILELTVDVMKWNYQKVPVSLGIDGALVGLTKDLVFDGEGHWVRPT